MDGMSESTTAATAAAEAEHEHEHHHDHELEERAHKLSMQCWRQGQRAASEEEWRQAVELGRQATGLVAEAPEPRFNLATALAGLAATTGDAAIRAEAAATYDAARALVPAEGVVRYAQEAVSLLEARGPRLLAEPAVQYALGTHLAQLGRTVKARRALQAAGADASIEGLATTALAEVPEPVVAQAPPVGRNDPCPCGSGRKYKKCHGAG
jgi:uncharacterized protein YecA (UPF0149 family)